MTKQETPPLDAGGTPVERPVGRLEPERDDDEYDDDYGDGLEQQDKTCQHCHGEGMDPMTDYLLPCWVCQREQRP